MNHFVKVLLPDSQLRGFSIRLDVSSVAGMRQFLPFLKWVQINGSKAPA
jgi:hypothetical protein